MPSRNPSRTACSKNWGHCLRTFRRPVRNCIAPLRVVLASDLRIQRGQRAVRHMRNVRVLLVTGIGKQQHKLVAARACYHLAALRAGAERRRHVHQRVIPGIVSALHVDCAEIIERHRLDVDGVPVCLPTAYRFRHRTADACRFGNPASVSRSAKAVYLDCACDKASSVTRYSIPAMATAEGSSVPAICAEVHCTCPTSMAHNAPSVSP